MAAKKTAKRTAKKNKPRVRLGTPKQYLWTLGVGLAVSLSIALLQGFTLGNPAYQNAQYLSDGCFVTSMLLLGAGALTWIGGNGFFDIFGYGPRCLPPLRARNGMPHTMITRKPRPSAAAVRSISC